MHNSKGLTGLKLFVIGYETNYLLVLLSRARIRAAGLEERVRIHWVSMWDADLSNW